MSSDRDTTRIVRSWLEEGVTTLPDRVLDAVLDQVPATQQRRSLWPLRRSTTMNSPARYAIAAAAVVLVAVVGYQLLPRNGGVGGEPTPRPSPTAVPTATAAVSAVPRGTPIPFSLTPSTGLLDPGPIVLDGAFPVTVTFEVPAGWARRSAEVADYAGVARVHGQTTPIWFQWTIIGNVYVDPCHPSSGLIDPPVGPTVDDLTAAMTSMVGFSATAITDVTIDGHAGKRFEISDTIDPKTAGCDDSVWLSLWDPAGGGDAARVPGATTMQFWVLDVDGTRLVMFTEDYGATASDLAEVARILESVRFG